MVVVGFLWHVLHNLLVPCIVLFLRMLGNGHRIPGWSTVLPFCRSVKSSINVLDNVLAVPAFIHMLESDTHVKSDIPTAYHLCVCLLQFWTVFPHGLRLLLKCQHQGVSCS